MSTILTTTTTTIARSKMDQKNNYDVENFQECLSRPSSSTSSRPQKQSRSNSTSSSISSDETTASSTSSISTEDLCYETPTRPRHVSNRSNRSNSSISSVRSNPSTESNLSSRVSRTSISEESFNDSYTIVTRSSLPSPPPTPLVFGPPVFCCKDSSKYLHDNHDGSSYAKFINLPFNGIATANGWNDIALQKVRHVIELLPTLSNTEIDTDNSPKNDIRYFAYLRTSEQYYEVTSDFFRNFEDENAFRGPKSFFTCAKHKQASQFLLYERRENIRETVGVKNPELSARKIAREKRRIMMRKSIYGRKEEIEELLGRKLKSLEDEFIPKFEAVDYMMARLSLYFKDQTSAAGE